ncbi:MAG TPA: lytic transglycosylase domain-containing protein [Limnochordia bacterium]|nr:lytic transglycosylase domain-containing protein [Limnochordia bacterium]
MGRLTTLLVLAVIVLVFLSAPFFLRGAFPLYYADIISVVAEDYDLDPMLLAAIIQVESSYRPEVVSPRGAIGLMQLMPETAIWLGEQSAQPTRVEDLLDPKTNIGLGAYYLTYLLERFPTQYAALAAYNAGPANARRWLDEHIWDGSYERTGQIPFGETRSYVRKVIMMHNLYTLLYK